LPSGVEVRSGTCLETDNLCVDPADFLQVVGLLEQLALTIRVLNRLVGRP
jgi:hypothetical protein